MNKNRPFAALLTLIVAGATLPSERIAAADWPNYRHDIHRSGVTSETLTFPLVNRWTHQPRLGPERAWPRPFRNNPYSGTKIAALLTYDHAFHPIVADGAVFYGSSADHQVHCLNLEDGREWWTFFAEGPIRNAPAYEQGRLYIGSDDGFVYCLDPLNGAEIWRCLVGPDEMRLPGNEQIISRWPVRTGVIVDGGVAYAAAGLFPKREGAFLCAMNAATGRVLWKQKVNQTTQGYMLATDSRLFVPSGKLAPESYERATGKSKGRVGNLRGNFALIADDLFLSGPGVSGGNLDVVDAQNSRFRIAKFDADHAVISASAVYLQGKNRLRSSSRIPIEITKLESLRDEKAAALKAETDAASIKALNDAIDSVNQRLTELAAKEKAFEPWEVDCPYSNGLILAGEVLVAGGDGEIGVFEAATGKRLWRHSVEGRAMGMAVSDGSLVVSTDQGHVYCFQTDSAETALPAPTPDRVSSVDFTPSAYGDTCAEILEAILNETPSDQGYALIFGVGDQGRLAAELARRTRLKVVCVDSDPEKIAAARSALDSAGLYGNRVVVHRAFAESLPYPRLLFNLILSQQTLLSGNAPPAEEVYRLLRPYGSAWIGQPARLSDVRLDRKGLETWMHQAGITDGTVIERAGGFWAAIKRGTLPGSGGWSHQYANPGNTACSEDTLESSDLRLRWFGKPGPFRMFDRHSYTTAPVYAGGRVFTLGERILYGNDAYNGTLLWELELPELEPRVNIPRDCGFMVATSDSVYVAAGGSCLQIDVLSGKRARVHTLPQKPAAFEYDWGYVSVENDLLFGSGVRKGSFYTDGRGPWYDDSGLGSPNDSLKVLSDFLFVQDRITGTPLWRYDGVIINSTIARGGGRIYFVENRNPTVLEDSSRRLAGGEEWGHLHTVALDAATGEKVWEKESRHENRTPVYFTAYKDEVLVTLRSYHGFDLRGLDAATGGELWAQQHGWESDNHGGHRRHPVLIGNEVYQQPNAYDLRTGALKWSTQHFGSNCGTLSASSTMMFSRLSNYPGMIDLRQEAKPVNLVEVTRPGCWINIIPAGGMILVPEAGSGCSCEFALHASMAFGKE